MRLYMFAGQQETDDTRYYSKMLQIYVARIYSSQYLKRVSFR